MVDAALVEGVWVSLSYYPESYSRDKLLEEKEVMISHVAQIGLVASPVDRPPRRFYPTEIDRIHQC